MKPDRTWSWKDEDKLADRTDHPWYRTVAEAAKIRAEGERVVERIESGAFPFDGTFCTFEPDSADPVTLPWWWDQVLAHQVMPRLPDLPGAAL